MHKLTLALPFAILLQACGGLAILPLLPQEGEENAPCTSDLDCGNGLVCGPCADGDCCSRSEGPCSPLYPGGDCPIGESCDKGLCIVGGGGDWCGCVPPLGCDWTDGSCDPVDATNRCSPTNRTGLCEGDDVCNGGQCVPCTNDNSCSENRSDGCCPPGGICVAGRCLSDIGDNTCSPQNTSGECELPGQICNDQGVCEDANCSSENPFGVCLAGFVCQGGSCDCIPCSSTHLGGCCEAGNRCSVAGECMEDLPNKCLADGDCYSGTFCACDDWCRADGTCVCDEDCASDETCDGGLCTRGCTLDTDCDTGFHCDTGSGSCIVDTCSSLGCTGLNRRCDASGAYALCTACSVGYHEASPAVDSCAPDTCSDIDCASHNRECDQSGAFAVCGACLPGFPDDGNGGCRECGVTADCSPGNYCSDAGSCTQDCEPPPAVSTCPDGRRCSPYGRCVAETTDPNACAAKVSEGEIVEPYLMLLLDRSGSMAWEYDDTRTGESRWGDLTDVLFNTTDGLVHSLQSQIRFGQVLYTGYTNGACPDLVQVDPALNNHAALEQSATDHGPSSGTPTGESIRATVDYLNTLPPGRSKYILLATDGEPYRCEDLGGRAGHALSAFEAYQAFASDIRLFMLSVGADVADDHMQDVANAGAGCPLDSNYDDVATCNLGNNGCRNKQNDVTDYNDYNPLVVDCPVDTAGNRINYPFYKATSRAQLLNDLTSILGSVLSCVVRLDIIPGCSLIDGSVYVDGDAVPRDPTNTDGWNITGIDTIEFFGPACDAITDGTAHFIASQFQETDSCDCPE